MIHIVMNTDTSVNQSHASADVANWVKEIAALTRPDAIHWCDGSEAEDRAMREAIVASGAGVWSNSAKRPNSLLVRSDPRDVARVEERTFICSRSKKTPDRQTTGRLPSK
jgi:phosphoenolpyruvate carboxykinase (GTP)